MAARLVLDGLRGGPERLEELRTATRTAARAATENAKIGLLSRVGYAISAWAKMEESLVVIAMHLLRTHPEKAGVVMYSIINPHTWGIIINDLFFVDSKLKKYQRKFNQIFERVRPLIDQRNQIAHHSIRGSDAAPQIKSSVFDARTKTKKLPPLDIGEIKKFSDKILNIANEFNNLASAMYAELHPSSEKFELKDDDPASH